MKIIYNHRYILYHLRWQISGIIMLPLMLYLEQRLIPLYMNLLIVQFFGAILFWFIDKRIFNDRRNIK